MVPTLSSCRPEDLPPTSNVLQTALWARFKEAVGWRPLAFESDAGGLLVLLRDVAPHTALAYVPHAPADPQTDLVSLSEALHPHLPSRTICVRFDLPWEVERAGESTQAADAGMRKAPVDVQPASTVMVLLDRDPDQMLAGMHKKHRYNIRLAGKKGVTVREAGADELPRWYALYEETAERDRITIHPLSYYARLFELAREAGDDGERPHLFLSFAEHDGQTLAGIIVSHCGTTATYLYGASSANKRDVMPNYAIQYGAMLRAQAAGMRIYDLFGIPPADDPNHSMHGLYRFKTGFGGRIVHRPGCWDAVVRPVHYGAFAAAERLRGYYYHTVRKRRAR